MKKLFLCLLALLLLSGCDLRNRMGSEYFIPTGETAPVYSIEPASQPPTFAPETRAAAQGAAVVKEVFSDKGSYTDRRETVWGYEYRLPYIDLASTAAAQINADIEKTYRKTVSEQLSLMEEQQPLSVTSITYEVYENGDILTLLVRRLDITGSISYSAYNFNHVNGNLVTGEDILAEAGLTAEEFSEQVTQQLSAEFENRFGQYAQTDSLLYATQQQKTLSEENISLNMPMYLDADGALNVIATVYCVGLRQGSDLYIIRLGG